MRWYTVLEGRGFKTRTGKRTNFFSFLFSLDVFFLSFSPKKLMSATHLYREWLLKRATGHRDSPVANILGSTDLGWTRKPPYGVFVELFQQFFLIVNDLLSLSANLVAHSLWKVFFCLVWPFFSRWKRARSLFLLRRHPCTDYGPRITCQLSILLMSCDFFSQ